ncbi:unnamed protein product [Rotaria sp. Silwood1]|nr:unnamed protein product [Rotaria sp. Silwood1]
MAAADVLFTQPGVNYDDQLFLNEYQNIFDTGNTSYGATHYGVTGGLRRVGAVGDYGFPLLTDAVYGGDRLYNGAEFGSADYDVSSWYGLSAADLAASQTAGFQQYITDTQGLYSNLRPRIIRRRVPGGGVTYQQNAGVQYLQPSTSLRPRSLIIRDMRSRQPPPPLPLRIRQQVRPLPPAPPLILNERPLAPPALVPSQTLVRRFNTLPVPPRPVVVESLPPLPPRPRPVILQRWLPYRVQAKRGTIVQRAPTVIPYPIPRNIVVQYEPTSTRVLRNVQCVGVIQADPQDYIRRYGASLLDSNTLERIARAAGVMENISPPILGSSIAANSFQFGSSTGTLGYDAGVVDFNGTDLEATFDGNSLDVLSQDNF